MYYNRLLYFLRFVIKKKNLFYWLPWFLWSGDWLKNTLLSAAGNSNSKQLLLRVISGRFIAGNNSD